VHNHPSGDPTPFRHGLRACELVGLRLGAGRLQPRLLHVRRVKGGTPSVHPLSGVELRALRRLQRESQASPFVFASERGTPFTTACASNPWRAAPSIRTNLDFGSDRQCNRGAALGKTALQSIGGFIELFR
jgi:integrase